MKITPRPFEGAVGLYDSNINIWEEPRRQCNEEYEKDFLHNVFQPLVRILRKRGWQVKRDERIWKRYRCLNKSHRYCVHPSKLEAKLGQEGRHIEIEFYQNITNVDNRNGGEYDFDKMDKMPYLLRLRATAVINFLSSWLCNRFGYEFKSDTKDTGPGQLTCEKYIAQHYDRHRFTGDKPLQDSEIPDYNKRGKDCELKNGIQVYFTDYKGRWLTGVIEHNINSMWWVKCGKYDLENKGCRNLQINPPPNLRRKNNAKYSRNRLEQVMREAINSNNFRRAEQIKNVLFGNTSTYRIRHKGKGWYGVQSRGYSSNRYGAGQYTETEASFAIERPEIYEVEVV